MEQFDNNVAANCAQIQFQEEDPMSLQTFDSSVIFEIVAYIANLTVWVLLYHWMMKLHLVTVFCRIMWEEEKWCI